MTSTFHGPVLTASFFFSMLRVVVIACALACLQRDQERIAAGIRGAVDSGASLAKSECEDTSTMPSLFNSMAFGDDELESGELQSPLERWRCV